MDRCLGPMTRGLPNTALMPKVMYPARDSIEFVCHLPSMDERSPRLGGNVTAGINRRLRCDALNPPSSSPPRTRPRQIHLIYRPIP